MSRESCLDIAQCLEFIQRKIEKPDFMEEITPDILRSLLKVVSIPKDIKVLLNAANSPRLRPIFKAVLRIIPIAPNPQDYSHVKPRHTEDCKDVFAKILNERNRTKGVLERTLQMNKVVNQDATNLSNSHFSTHNVPIHCECRIIQHCLENRQQLMYSYIGVSKLSCAGCHEYIKAVNSIYEENFQTKGTHSKFYYPWAFGPFPGRAQEEQAVAGFVFTSLARRIGGMYPGFTPSIKELSSDSEPQTISTSDQSREDSDSEEERAFFETMRSEYLKEGMMPAAAGKGATEVMKGSGGKA